MPSRDRPPNGYAARTVVRGSFVVFTVWELDARDGYARLLWEKTLPVDADGPMLSATALRQLRKLREAARD